MVAFNIILIALSSVFDLRIDIRLETLIGIELPFSLSDAHPCAARIVIGNHLLPCAVQSIPDRALPPCTAVPIPDHRVDVSHCNRAARHAGVVAGIAAAGRGFAVVQHQHRTTRFEVRLHCGKQSGVAGSI